MGMLDRWRDPSVAPRLAVEVGGDGPFLESGDGFEFGSINLRNCSLFMMAVAGNQPAGGAAISLGCQ